MNNKTANGQYSYDQDYETVKGIVTLHTLVEACHKALSTESGWGYFPLQPGMFGYDNMTVSLGHALDKMTLESSEEEVADLIHQGWIINYIFWRDNKPWEIQSFFKKPAKLLGDKRRDTCASTKFSDLNKDEKDKDIIIAKTLINFLH